MVATLYLPYVNIFFVFVLLCKSTLFIESSKEKVIKLRRCFHFCFINRWLLRSLNFKNYILLQTGSSYGANSPIIIT